MFKRICSFLCVLSILCSAVTVNLYVGAETDDQKILKQGTYDELTIADRTSSGIAKKDGTYYRLNGDFNITQFSTVDVLNKTEKITVDGHDYGCAFAPRDNTGICDADNTYVQYRVDFGTVIKIPIIVEKVNTMSNYSRFSFKISTDGENYDIIPSSSITHEDSEQKFLIPYNIRVYTITIPANCKYLRVVWPKFSDIKANSYWNGSRANQSAVMMLPAHCENDAVLGPGLYETLTDENKSLSGYAEKQGKFYTLNGNFNITNFKDVDDMDNAAAIKIDGRDYSSAFSLSVNTGITESENAYIDYNVRSGTTVVIPVLAEYEESLSNYSGFEFAALGEGDQYSILSAGAITYTDEVFKYTKKYNLRLYSVAIPTGCTSLRILWPKYDDVKAHSYNKGANAETSALMMLPAYCIDESILSPGKYQILKSSDINESGYAATEGTFYKLNGRFRITDFSKVDVLQYTQKITVGERDYTCAFAPSDNSGIVEDVENTYTEYRVQGGSVIEVPIIAEKDNSMSNYNRFKFKSSADGETYNDITSTAISYVDEVQQYTIKFNVRIYKIIVPTDSKYLRIVWPVYNDVVLNSYWSGSRASQSAIMMLPATCTNENIMASGVFEKLSVADIDYSGYAKSTGRYYILNGNFNITEFSKFNAMNNTENLTVDVRKFNCAFTLSKNNGSNGDSTYIQYSVKGGSEIKIPIVAENSSADSLYNQFRFLYSADGITYTALSDDALSYKDMLVNYAYTFNIRVYSLAIPEECTYLRVIWPSYSSIADNSNFNGSYESEFALMMLPAFCEEPDILAPGISESLSANDCDEDGYAKHRGRYYRINGNFNVTDFKSLDTMNNTEKVTIEGCEYTAAFTIAENSGLAAGEKLYVQYHVQNNTIIKIPIISRKDNTSDYDKFVFMYSADGESFNIIDETAITYTDTTLSYKNDFNARVYMVVTPSDCEYLRIICPDYSNIVSDSKTSTPSLMMLPAYCKDMKLTFDRVSLTIGEKLKLTYKGVTGTKPWIGIFFENKLMYSFACDDENGVTEIDTTGYSEGTFKAIAFENSSTNNPLYSSTFSTVLPITVSEQQTLLPGTYDTILPETYNRNNSTKTANNGDRIINAGASVYMKPTGNVQGNFTGQHPSFAPTQTVSMWGRIYSYVYMQYSITGLASNAVSLSYKVANGTQLQIPIGIKDENICYFDKFVFEFSSDGITWTPVADDDISYTDNSVKYKPCTYVIRNYAVEVIKDGYFRLTWPNQTEIANAGTIFVIPPAAFVSSYAASVKPKDEQYIVNMDTPKVMKVLQVASSPATVRDIRNNLVLCNSYVRFYDADGREMGDEALLCDGMIMRCFSSGSKCLSDDSVFEEWSVVAKTVQSLIVPRLTSLNDQVIINDEQKTITAYYYSDDVMSLKNMLSMLRAVNCEMTLLDINGYEYTNTEKTVGISDLYIQLTAKDCPDIEDGYISATYKVVGIQQNKEYAFESLDEKLVSINTDTKTVNVKGGMTIAEFLKSVNLNWCDVVFYEVMDEFDSDFVEIFDQNAEIIPGMSMDLYIANTTIHYDFNVLPKTGDSSSETVLITVSLLMSAAMIGLFCLKSLGNNRMMA